MAIFYLFIFVYGEITLKRSTGPHSKLVWMSRLVTAHTRREGMKRLIAYIMGFLEEHGWLSKLARKGLESRKRRLTGWGFVLGLEGGLR